MSELVREAKGPDGQVVVSLRCFDGELGTMVEAQVTPQGGQPTHRGPYRFASAQAAFRFLQEAMLAFEYLGCTVG